MPMTREQLVERLRSLQRHEVSAVVMDNGYHAPWADVEHVPDANGDWVRWEDVAALLAEVN
jgi:hypothetical protein